MKIRRNSWHYRLIAKNWDRNPDNLCWYFWKIVFSICAAIFIGVVMVIGGVVLTVSLLVPILGWFFPWITQDLGMPILSAVLWVAIAIGSLKLNRNYLYSQGILKKEYKPPGLVREYLNAKHHKICPLLEYTNE